MTSLELRHLLLDRSLAIADLAKSIRRPGTDSHPLRSHVSQVVHGHLRTPYIRRGIAEALGKTYSEVWGEADPEATLTPVQVRGENHLKKRGHKRAVR